MGVIGAILLFYVTPVYVLGWFDAPVVEAPKPRAALIVTFGPRRVYAEGSSTRVKSIEVKVVNRGEVPAEEISVFGEVRGSRFPLRGPLSLAVGASGTYIGDVTVSLSADDQVRTVLLCQTCPPEQVGSDSHPSTGS
jgi:hypothetical protein